MLIWFIIVAATILVAAFVLRPLIADAPSVAARSTHDMSVYRDQLAEIEADLERGLIPSQEAAAARLEISRRLLAASPSADAASHGQAHPKPAGSARFAAWAGGLCLIASALGGYLVLGSPQFPDQPLAARLSSPDEGSRLALMVQQVEGRLQANPADGAGWDVIAPIYMRMRRFPDAANAYRNAIQLLGETPKRLIGFGEALVISSDGVVGEDARRAFTRAAASEPERLEPRFWLAIAAEQDGRWADAKDAFVALLRDGDAKATWRPLVEERLAAIETQLAAVAPGAAAPDLATDGERGPSAADIASASQMSATERNQMIEQMVAGLAERLAENGKDLKGWQMLMRSYMMLSKPDQARAAYLKATEIFANEPAALDDLRKQAGELGVAG